MSLTDAPFLRGRPRLFVPSWDGRLYATALDLTKVLTRDEVISIIGSCENIKHKAMLMVTYSAGLRVSEAAALKVQHIDSKTMCLFVDYGKGGKDRYTLLSEACLSVLREYWKTYRPNHPEGWLFLDTYNVSHITSRGIASAFNEAVKRANITKNVSIHSLRYPNLNKIQTFFNYA